MSHLLAALLTACWSKHSVLDSLPRSSSDTRHLQIRRTWPHLASNYVPDCVPAGTSQAVLND